MKRKHADEETEFPLAALVRLVHAQRGHMSTRQRVEGAEVLSARAEERLRGVRFSWKALVGAALVLSVVLLGFVSLARMRPTAVALSYAIDGGHVGGGGLIEPESSSPPRLRFSDGTEVLLTTETKAAVRSVSGHGARVSLVEGSAHVDVVHAAGASWLFDAGPFLVAVTGTAFTVEWTPLDEKLDLRMERGTVEVSGPLSDGTISLRSGQHLVVRVRQRETLIRDAEEGEGAAPLKRTDSEIPPAEPTASPAAATGGYRGLGNGSGPTFRPSHGEGDRDWAAWVVKGDYESVIRQAERRGLDASLAEVNSMDLAALADAARYGRHDDVARRALLAQRRRFPYSSAAHDACFLLGRLEETRRELPEAVMWYEKYLSESPLGTYASEALGRKMNVLQQVYGDERARPVAEEYLSRFPQGTYTTRARVLARAQ